MIQRIFHFPYFTGKIDEGKGASYEEQAKSQPVKADPSRSKKDVPKKCIATVRKIERPEEATNRG